MHILRYTLLMMLCIFQLHGVISLKDNLRQAKPGEFIVASQNKNYTLLHVFAKTGDLLTIEEITIPAKKVTHPFSWRAWLAQGAPFHTSWILHTMHISNGRLLHSYSVSQQSWLDTSQNNNLLALLFNLNLYPIPNEDRRRLGFASSPSEIDNRPLWQPKMIVDGQVIPGVKFTAWKARWPKDGTPLANKFIELYLPESSQYPTYFPFWLQVRDLSGSKATIHIIDSGSQLISPVAQPTKG